MPVRDITISINRIRFAAVLALVLCGLPTHAAEPTPLSGELTKRWGLSIEGGIMKPTEGEWDYGTLDQFGAVRVLRGLSPYWVLKAGLKLGHTRAGAVEPGQDVGWSFEGGNALYTTLSQPMLELEHRFTPDAWINPTLSAGLGWTSWRVLDLSGESVDWFPGGEAVEGFDTNGDPAELSGRELTLGLGLGLNVRINSKLRMSVGARYQIMPGLERDNVGLANIWGPDHVDANTALAEGHVGVTWWFGAGDRDRDGVADDRDQCPDTPEDHDGYNDTDGCPDLDNDGDGVPDDSDACPSTPEDVDGFRDDDGCPDSDNDGDLVPDERDGCPDLSEDIDGFEDRDGCPDPDNDGDGVQDDDDRCPGTPADSLVDETGCAIEIPTAGDTEVHVPETPTEDIVLDDLAFRSGSAVLSEDTLVLLEDVAAWLANEPDVQIEIRGHTDDVGNAALNRTLSLRRAEAVRRALIDLGLPAARLTAIGYGEDLPIADNLTASGRATNRRVEIHRLH